MRAVHQEILIAAGVFPASSEWARIEKDVLDAVQAIWWPSGSRSFTLYDESGKGRGKGNGVKPIKDAFLELLRQRGWSLETTVDVATLKKPGPVDAALRVGSKLFCVEWETGNISSSHRALNKIAMGLLKGVLVGGMLVLPTRKMYKYLTDRVGNYQEIEPYFPMWRSLIVKEGLLGVLAVEHDAVSRDVPKIPKGTDGRALL